MAFMPIYNRFTSVPLPMLMFCPKAAILIDCLVDVDEVVTCIAEQSTAEDWEPRELGQFGTAVLKWQWHRDDWRSWHVGK